MNKSIDWGGFADRTAGRPPRSLLVDALKMSAPSGLTALDIGAGAGNETLALIDAGFAVTAVDPFGLPASFVAGLTNAQLGRLSIVRKPIERFPFDKYDLIVACHSLPFLSKQFGHIWHLIRSALNSGGLFVGDFFGPDDSRNVDYSRVVRHDRSAVAQLLSGMQVIELREVAGAPTRDSTKHLHYFEVIARC